MTDKPTSYPDNTKIYALLKGQICREHLYLKKFKTNWKMKIVINEIYQRDKSTMMKLSTKKFLHKKRVVQKFFLLRWNIKKL